MALQELTNPAQPALLLERVKDHLRVEHYEDDTYIDLLIEAATDHAQRYTRRQLINRDFILYLDGFPRDSRIIKLPKPPVSAISYVQYTDTGGTTGVTFAASKYHTDFISEPPRIALKTGEVWPSTECNTPNSVQIEYTAGYGATYTSIPDGIRQAMLIMIGHWYENREAVIVTGGGVIVKDVPLAAEHLFKLHRVLRFPT